ncbi:MAG: MOSC domain-containing protein [Dehalococcoidia bacterium]
MPHVAALYRYPVKGFTPEFPETLFVRPDGRIEGDRVLAFRFADAVEPLVRDGLDYWPKSEGLAMQDFPGIGPLQLRFDQAGQRVHIQHNGDVIVDADLDEKGRALICERVAAFVLETPEGDRLREEGHLPLALIGDGRTSQFQDRPRGFISVHGRGSVLALAEALGTEVDERRFRSNIAVEGLSAWDELAWAGRVRVGEAEFRVSHHIVRCLATHANPDTGERDAPVMTTLTRTFGQEQPTLGTLLLPAGATAERGATIRVGDAVDAFD